nr:hypothetical protein [Flavobacterium silvaticum]
MKNFTYVLLLLTTMGFAQHKVETSIDTTKNKIGAQFNLTLRTNVDTLSQVVFPSGTNFGPMEVIRNYVVDTVKKDNRYELIKRYGLANFDSGAYTIPQLKVIINKKPFLSDSLRVEVSPVKVDTIKQKMFDIKPIAQDDSSHGTMFWIWIVLGILLCAAGGAVVYFLVKKAQQKQTEQEIFKTPIEKATTLLSNLEKKELWQKGEVKDYYSQLTDIARTYIEEVVHIPAMESTTSELIVALRSAASQKNMPIAQETFENLERVLKQADLVKFAKSRPLDFEIAEDRNKIERVIVTIDKSVPTEVEEDDSEAFRELQRQKLMKQKRRKRIMISVASVLFLLLATGTYFVIKNGFRHTVDAITGKQTLYLLEGEWVKSEYGNPSVIIETPKVLVRTNADTVLPKDVMALMKEFQMFGYGSVTGDFYIGVSTNTYKGEQQVDLEKAMDAAISVLEKQGAQNMLIKQETYDTKEGVNGRKAYGTFSRIDSGSRSSAKYYYEMLLFGQQNGLQLITLIYPEGDEYAKQISDRVLNSVELKTVSQ